MAPAAQRPAPEGRLALDGEGGLSPALNRVVRALIPVHRWLGIAFCVIFLIWFASGIVMVYKRMPEYSPQERLTRLSPLKAGDIHLGPADALEKAQLLDSPQRVRLTTLGSRPVYRFFTSEGWVTVFADDGTVLDPLMRDEAVAVVRSLFPEHAGTVRYEELLETADQWTFITPFQLTGPLHKVALGDPAATDVYVASTTGEAVLKTDRASRLWGYAGPVMHWMYFRPLRAHGQLWSALIVYGSLTGCALCVLGLVIGASRYSIANQYRGRTSASPYTGWLQWHHYGGLIFGVVTFTWVFSGMLSMEPWHLTVDNGPTEEQVNAIRGNGVDLMQFQATPPAALAQFQKRFAPAEVELQQFMGTPYYIAYNPSAVPGDEDIPLQHTLVEGRDARMRGDFSRDELLNAAEVAMPGIAPAEVSWLTAYDSYYYGPAHARRLPVLRVKFNDPQSSWLYLDPHNGALVLRETSDSRPLRWFYHGLHSLDFPGLYQAWWAWTSVVVLLSAGGIFLTVTSMVIGWRHLRRKGIRRVDAPRGRVEVARRA